MLIGMPYSKRTHCPLSAHKRLRWLGDLSAIRATADPLPLPRHATGALAAMQPAPEAPSLPQPPATAGAARGPAALMEPAPGTPQAIFEIQALGTAYAESVAAARMGGAEFQSCAPLVLEISDQNKWTLSKDFGPSTRIPVRISSLVDGHVTERAFPAAWSLEAIASSTGHLIRISRCNALYAVGRYAVGGLTATQDSSSLGGLLVAAAAGGCLDKVLTPHSDGWWAHVMVMMKLPELVSYDSEKFFKLMLMCPAADAPAAEAATGAAASSAAATGAAATSEAATSAAATSEAATGGAATSEPTDRAATGGAATGEDLIEKESDHSSSATLPRGSPKTRSRSPVRPGIGWRRWNTSTHEGVTRAWEQEDLRLAEELRLAAVAAREHFAARRQPQAEPKAEPKS